MKTKHARVAGEIKRVLRVAYPDSRMSVTSENLGIADIVRVEFLTDYVKGVKHMLDRFMRDNDNPVDHETVTFVTCI